MQLDHRHMYHLTRLVAGQEQPSKNLRKKFAQLVDKLPKVSGSVLHINNDARSVATRDKGTTS